MTTESWDDYKDRVRLRCARQIRWDYEQRAELPVDRAKDVVSAAQKLDLRRIGDRRADELIDALLRLAIERYLETYELEPDEAVEGYCFRLRRRGQGVARGARRAEHPRRRARASPRRQEAAYEAAACVAALREKPRAGAPASDRRRITRGG
jgi:hypothetical protein